MPIKFKCEHCSTHVIVKFLKKGEKAECKFCGKLTIVPENAEGSIDSEISRDANISNIADDRFNNQTSKTYLKDIQSMRHEKESLYFTISAAIGVILWILIVVGTIGIILIYGLFIALGLWIAQQFFKAVIFGNAVRVTEDQYPKINDIVKSNCTELGLVEVPDVFIVNGQGAVNAVAIKFLSKRYVLLFSDLVDLMLKRDEINELKMIIGHELAHHAAGHTSIGRNLLIGPAKFIPFLGPAYSRACELTADRIGHKLTEDSEASKRALVSIASGSESLASDINIEAFKKQEAEIPPFFGFLHEIFGTHPRITKRILEIEKIM